MYDVKKMFSEENFNNMDLTEMIWSAMGIYEEFMKENTYIWVSYNTYEAEEGSLDKTDFENRNNGFIVEITCKDSEDIWDSVVRSFVDYFNTNFNRHFEYDEWYEPEIEENDSEIFTDDQLFDIFDTCHNICLDNRYEKEPYFIMVDMENYRAIKAVKEIETTEEKYEFIPVEPLEYPYLTEVYDNCQTALYKHFDIDFEVTMIYEFRIYE